MVTGNLVSGIVADDLAERLVALRHDIHQHPELSMEESRTARVLEEALHKLGISNVKSVAEHGILTRIPGRDPNAPVVAVRGDIDALPIQEETGASYSSENDGVMHACGHDVHAAWTAGAASLLSSAPPAGDVLVLLQPAEETAQGALAVLESGCLENVGAIVGAHVDMRYPLGTVVAQPGHMAASADEFSIRLVGSGSHAARPHEGLNPIIGGCTLVGALHDLPAANVPPGTPAVLTVATFNSGCASNVIPEEALLTGTVRAVDPETRRVLQEEIRRTVAGIADAHRLKSEVEFQAGTPPLVNDPVAAEWAREATRKVLGPHGLVPLGKPNLGGEDFAYYLERYSGCFVRVGGRAPGQDPIPAHSSGFLPDDQAVLIGAAVLAETARIASEQLAQQDG